MEKVCLVDVENVANRWVEVVLHLCPQKVVLFYSERACKITYTELAEVQSKGIELIYKLAEIGSNALDFQLSSYLGYLIANNEADEYIIISEDTGYDCVIAFWKRNNIKFNIVRIGVNKKKLNKFIEDIRVALPEAEKKEAEVLYNIINSNRDKNLQYI